MKYLTADLQARHGFFTRQGGVSRGLFDTLNCGYGSGDQFDCVTENRGRIATALSLPVVLTLYQTHSADVVRVTQPWDKESAPKADAMVTDQPGIGLGILTADCAPVLFVCRKTQIIGAAHAGWKGALSGVLQATVTAMRDMGAVDIEAAIGPTISAQSYEVDLAFQDKFLAQSLDNRLYFKPATRTGHVMFDLPSYCRDILRAEGLAHVADIARDTRQESDRFFSYRRATLNKDPAYGRQMSVIALADQT